MILLISIIQPAHGFPSVTTSTIRNTGITGFGGTVQAINYNTAGLPTSYTFSNGITTNITYNTRNLTTRITAGTAFDNGYTYDSRGNTTNITNYLDNTKNQSFTYDSLSRLAGFNGAWGTGSYTYSSVGNRLTKIVAGSTTSYSYSSNRLSSTSGGEPQTFSYNGYGSLTATTWKGVNYSLTYDSLNNLKTYKSGATVLADFAYDGDGMRVTKTASGKTVVYHYDKDGRVLSETDSSSNRIADYIYANGKLMAKIVPSAVYFFHTDPAGTPMAMTNTSKTVIWKADYRPFGEEQTITGTIENNEKFVGKEKDKETGLYYFGARYMEPRIGRFAAVDPIGPVSGQTGKANEKLLLNPQQLNRYAYSLNNPYRYKDEDGKWAEDVHSGIGNLKYGTYTWARQAGFNDKDAKIIARGNNATDKNAGWAVITGVPGRHFNTSILSTVDSRQIFAEKDLQTAVALYRQRQQQEALAILGRGLHGLQDIIAHGDWPFIWPHPSWFDSAEERPAALKQTESRTKEYLNRFRDTVDKHEND
ncbi:MAG: RHS repeat-associated core domain-containing protein [Nitrospirota bacterium]